MQRRSITDRIVAALDGSGPRSAADLAREFLGLGILDEEVAERLLGPTLDSDPRLLRTSRGWIAGPAPRASGTPLDAPFAAVVAPRHLPAHGLVRRGDGAPALTVALGGEPEAQRHELLDGTPLPRPVIDLMAVARRCRGYRGPAEPVRVAEWLGVPHVEPAPLETQGGAAAQAEIVAEIWSLLVAELCLEGAGDVSGLERLLDARLETADFGGKRFGPADLEALPERPGVYRFAGKDGRTLYVGQSVNLRARVLSYFAGPPRDEKDRAIRREAVALATRTLDCGPDALIEEARWIARFSPRLNVRRGVAVPAPGDGVLVAPSPWTGGAVLFSIARRQLVRRRRLLPGPRRAWRAAAEAVDAVLEPPAPPAGARRAASLIASWRKVHPHATFIEPGRDGGRAQMIERIARMARD